MSTLYVTRPLCHPSSLRRWAVVFALLFTACAPAVLYAQSTCAPDASGDFKPTASVTCQLPESGEFSYRDVVIPARVSIRFLRNTKNTPVTIRASGNVTISGVILLDGTDGDARQGGKGGPGGFDGGRGGSALDSPAGAAGDGPSGGSGGTAGGVNRGGAGSFALSGQVSVSPDAAAGQLYGTNTLLPLIGGSGGGGGGAGAQGVAGGGGGGGGAILIFCAGTIRFDFQGDGAYGIYARGGHGGCRPTEAAGGGGSGSGGAIRLVANAIIGNYADNRPDLNVEGGGHFCCISCQSTHTGGPGYIRIEALDLSQFIPNASITISTSLSRGPATLTNNPQLKIQSVGGRPAPTNPVGSFYRQPDITVPTSVANPVTVAVQGMNIPANTTIQVTLTKESGEKETKTCALGSQSPPSCNVSFTLPTTGVAVITASATLDVLLALGRPLIMDGERVDKVEIAAAFGGESQLIYITKSGRRLPAP